MDDLVSIKKKNSKQQLHLTASQDFLLKKEKKKEKHFLTVYSEICEATSEFSVCSESLQKHRFGFITCLAITFLHKY